MRKCNNTARINGKIGRLRVEVLEGRWVPSTAAMFQSTVAYAPAMLSAAVDLDAPALSRPAPRPQIEISATPSNNTITPVRPEQPLLGTTDTVGAIKSFNARPVPNTTDGSVLVRPTPLPTTAGDSVSGNDVVGAKLEKDPNRLGGGLGTHDGNLTGGDATDAPANQNGSSHSPSADLASEFRPLHSAKETAGHSGTLVTPIEGNATHVVSTEVAASDVNSPRLDNEAVTRAESPSGSGQSPIHIGWINTNESSVSSYQAMTGDYRAEARSVASEGIFAGRRTGKATDHSGASLGFNTEAPTVADEAPLSYQATALVLHSPEPLVAVAQESVSALLPHTAGLHTALSAFEMPMLNLSAWGEQVADLIQSLTTSETTVIVSSCVVVLLAAGVGAETLRRHRRRTMLQLVSNAPGAVVLDLSLLV